MDCSLCREAFSEEGPRVPRNLDCGHTFCTECIQQLDRHATLRQGPRCPDCRAVIKTSRRSIVNLPKNYKLLELIRETSVPVNKPGADTSETYYDSTAVSQSMAPQARSVHCGYGTRGRNTNENHEEASVTTSEAYYGWNYGSSQYGGIYPLPSRVGEWIPSIRHPNRRGSDSRSLAQPPNSMIEDPLHFQLPVQQPVARISHEEQLPMALISSPLFSSQTSLIPPTPPNPLVLPSPGPDVEAPLHNAVETGRAVTGPNGTLVCKFFQEGTCRFGPYCWFNHPVLNENKAICRHWKKGQCRMGLSCNYRHGTTHPVQPSRRQRPTAQRDPTVAGPSGEGVSNRPTQPSVVVLVSNSGNTVHRPPINGNNSNTQYQQQNQPQRNHLIEYSESSTSETFFDVFGSSNT